MCSTWKSCTKYSFGLVKQLLVFVVFSGDVQYSEKLRKVFVRFDAACPFLFSSSPSTPRDCVVRAMPIFLRPQHAQEVVRRCPHHTSMASSVPGAAGPPSSHLIRCEHKLANYFEDKVTRFHSVVVPYDVPPGILLLLTYLIRVYFGGWFGVVVIALVTATKLNYVEPG